MTTHLALSRQSKVGKSVLGIKGTRDTLRLPIEKGFHAVSPPSIHSADATVLKHFQLCLSGRVYQNVVRQVNWYPKLIVRWQSATVVQQALVKSQYGDRAETSAEAQKRLEPNATYYVIAVGNLPVSQKPSDADARRPSWV